MNQGERAEWFLYVLRCRDGTWYTGITNDLRQRMEKHAKGTASKYTRSRLPVKMVHHEPCTSRSDALKKERKLKSLSREEKIRYVGNYGKRER